MTKEEFISKYGEDAYEQHKLKNRNWYEQHKDQCKQLHKKWGEQHKDQLNSINRKWYEKHKEQCYQTNKKWKEKHRIIGYTPYCTKNYDLIENYELAKADNFDPTKWHLHHRLENYWSKTTLKRKDLYYDVNPEALIWLTYDEHMKDIRCKNSKWHKRSLEK